MERLDQFCHREARRHAPPHGGGRGDLALLRGALCETPRSGKVPEKLFLGY